MKAVKNYFENYYSPTIIFEFFTFNVKIKDTKIRLQIWDTCGQEVYRSLIRGFYRNSSLAILVYSIDDPNTFSHLNFWLNEIKTQGNPDVKMILIGNKVDLDDKRKVSTDEGNKFNKEHGFHLFLETSAKTGLNVQKLFIEAANILYEENLSYKNRESVASNKNESNIEAADFNQDISNQLIIDEDNTKKPKKKFLCC